MRWLLSAPAAALLLVAGCTDQDVGVPQPPPTNTADPDSVTGTDPKALQRPQNLRRALARLEKERQDMEGRYSNFRLAPGRIDAQIMGPEQMMNIQIRPDLSIPFVNNTPTSSPDRDGLTGRDIDVQGPERLLGRIDRRRSSNAARDLDYMVVSKSTIDGDITWSAFLKTGPRPRSFLLEGGNLRPIG